LARSPDRRQLGLGQRASPNEKQLENLTNKKAVGVPHGFRETGIKKGRGRIAAAHGLK